MSWRRWLYLLHRWFGVGMCLLFAMWFFSGVVMMYVGFPRLGVDERLAALPALQAQSLRFGPQALLAQLDDTARIDGLRLSSVTGRPAYLLQTAERVTFGLFADTGERFAAFGEADALRAAAVYADTLGLAGEGGPDYRDRIDVDQWSVSSELHRHRPLHRVALHDAAGTELYVSSRTGEVVRDTSASERAWNWLGANLHWLYPLQLRRHGSLWYWLVVVVSLAGLVSIITGAVVGVMRLRLRKRYRGRDVTPYRGALKLHHLMGLCFLLPLTTFLFSGLMSMGPWGIFDDDLPYGEQRALYRQVPPPATALDGSTDVAALRRVIAARPDSREVVWHWLAGQPHLYTVSGDVHRAAVTAPADWAGPALAQIQQAMAGHAVSAIDTLARYDSYYYAHHDDWRPLPVLRARFDDPAQSWFHIDLATGELLNRLTATGRLERWIYNGLHSLDFQFLINRRPLWDVVVITLSIAGLVLSLTSVIIAWRRLKPKPKRRNPRRAGGSARLPANSTRATHPTLTVRQEKPSWQ
ncbi:PepSY-associated TM helix domain-containing protein [Parahaliea mediterranea]|uniref:PepSY-associated TM helix domain-containing protein n=1 Tax=Parahaliea mediterranea TaxID=651086 RepID=UPI000E2FEB8F|nr:PepSY-associated TM helix domain-containing protein [Parahaliea mediterranea]